MKMEITSTIQNINEKEWNALAGTDFPGKNYRCKNTESSVISFVESVVMAYGKKVMVEPRTHII
jgi:hypothetical protein